MRGARVGSERPSHVLGGVSRACGAELCFSEAQLHIFGAAEAAERGGGLLLCCQQPLQHTEVPRLTNANSSSNDDANFYFSFFFGLAKGVR